MTQLAAMSYILQNIAACTMLCVDSRSAKAFFISYFTFLGWRPLTTEDIVTFMSRFKYPILPSNHRQTFDFAQKITISKKTFLSMVAW